MSELSRAKQSVDQRDLKALHGMDYALRLRSLEEPKRLRAILSRDTLPPGAVVLDAGCGSGPLAAEIGDRVAEYHGVDFSEAFIALAKASAHERNQRNCEFHCADVVAFIDQQPGRFDRLYALDLSEHVPDDEWAAMVAAFRRALKPGGRAIVHTPNLDFFVERIKQHGVILEQFPEHVAVRTARGNARFFENAGFSPVRVSFLPHYNVLRFCHPLSYVPAVGRLFAARVLITATRG